MSENSIQRHGGYSDGVSMMHRRGDTRSVKNRIQSFSDWCDDSHINWMQADLSEYRDDLLEHLAPSSVQAHLSTLRARIRDIVTDNNFIGFIHGQLSDKGMGFQEAELRVQAISRQMENMANPRHSHVKVLKKQDKVDDERVWLDKEQKQFYIDHVGDGKPEVVAIRDKAIIATMLATGVRAAELCNIKIADIFQKYEGHLALRVSQGKGNKQRVVLYGDLLEYMTEHVTPWLEISIRKPKHDYLFYGFWRDYTVLRDRPMNTSTIRRMVVDIHNPWGVAVTPHDFRRTYARTLYIEYNMKVEWIKRQLGHTDARTTESYIGDPDVSLRIPSKHPTRS